MSQLWIHETKNILNPTYQRKKLIQELEYLIFDLAYLILWLIFNRNIIG